MTIAALQRLQSGYICPHMTDFTKDHSLSPDTPGVPQPRSIGAVNWRGLWTLYVKEVRRFLNVATQTVVAPMVTGLLFLTIFTLALGRGNQMIEGFTYASFLAPGLIMMQMIQNSFANTSSSILIAKIQGNIVDVLMPPLNAAELTAGIALGGVTRGLIVGAASTFAMAVFVDLPFADPLAILYFGIMGSLMLSLLGMIGGIWAEKFDHMSAVTNFVIVPFSFLSGTFYSIDRLPDGWSFVAHFNPFFFIIDGFRYGYLGEHDSELLTSMTVVGIIDLLLVLVVWRMFATGYRLKP